MSKAPPKIKRCFRGEIYYADMSGLHVIGSEQSGTRPVIIIQNDVGNYYSPTVIVAVITSSELKAEKNIPTHLNIDLFRPSTIMCEQIITISKMRLREKIGQLPPNLIAELDEKIMISLGLAEGWKRHARIG